MCWIESALNGPATVKPIFDGNHVKRGKTAHLVTLQALFIQYQNVFLQRFLDELKHLEELSRKLADACANGKKHEAREANANLMRVIESLRIVEKMTTFDAAQKKKPMFKVMRQYMRIVMEMLTFIRAVRTGDWKLHPKALELFTKNVFAHDRLNYVRMIPLYLAEMASLETSDPEIYAEFLQGNWVVNKNLSVPFCALGADHGLEHINRSMKVTRGLVGISINPSA